MGAKNEWVDLSVIVLCFVPSAKIPIRIEKGKNWNNKGKNSIFYAFFSVFTVFSLLCGHNFPFYARYTYTTGCVEWNKKNRFISLSDGDIYGWVLKSACAVHGEIRAPLLLLCWFGRNGIQIKQVDLGVVTLFRFLFIFFLSYPLLWFFIVRISTIYRSLSIVTMIPSMRNSWIHKKNDEGKNVFFPVLVCSLAI